MLLITKFSNASKKRAKTNRENKIKKQTVFVKSFRSKTIFVFFSTVSSMRKKEEKNEWKKKKRKRKTVWQKPHKMSEWEKTERNFCYFYY